MSKKTQTEATRKMQATNPPTASAAKLSGRYLRLKFAGESLTRIEFRFNSESQWKPAFFERGHQQFPLNWPELEPALGLCFLGYVAAHLGEETKPFLFGTDEADSNLARVLSRAIYQTSHDIRNLFYGENPNDSDGDVTHLVFPYVPGISKSGKSETQPFGIAVGERFLPPDCVEIFLDERGPLVELGDVQDLAKRIRLSLGLAPVGRCEPPASNTVATIERDSRTEDSIGFVRTLRPGIIPDAMAIRVPNKLVVRQKELSELTERLSLNAVVPIEGVAQSGKTALVAELLGSDSPRRKLAGSSSDSSEVSVLYIDLSVAVGPRPVLRRLAYAMGELKRIPDADDSEIATLTELRAQLLHEILLARLRARAPLAVLDDVDCIPLTNENLADLRAFLEFIPFRQGAILSLSGRPVSQKVVDRTGREIKKAIEVGPLSPSEAEQLLTTLLDDRSLAAATVAQIKDTPELLLPGAFAEGIAAFKSQLNVGSIEKKPTILADTILECASDDVLKTLKASGCDFAAPSEGGPLGQRVSIMAMAVLARQAVTEQHLRAARLPVEFYERLRDQCWLQKREDGFCLPSIICAALRVQVEAMLKGSAGENDCSELADAVDALIQAAESQTAHDDETILDEALEEAISWLEHKVPGESLLADRLWSAFLPHTADDLVSPISSSGSVELLKRLGVPSKPLSLATAIAKLVLEARVGNDAKQFLKSLKAAIDFATRSSGITVHQLRGMDGAAFSGTARYQLFAEVFELRAALADKLCDWTSSVFAALSFKRSAASWMLTTADLAFRLGKPVELSKRLLNQAREWLGSPEQPGSVWGAASELGWLRARASRLAALFETDPDTRIKHLHDAVAGAEQALVHGARKINQTRFYLRMVRNLLPELPQENHQRQAVAAAVDVVGKTFGPERADWPLEIYAQLAALLRHEARFVNSPQIRLSQIHAAVQFLQPAESRAVYLSQEGDTRPLLVLARLHRGLAHELARQGQYRTAEEPANEASRLAELAVKRNANAAAWSFLIGLGNISLEATTSFGRNYESLGRTDSRLNETTKELIKRCRSWLDDIEQPGIAEGQVALKCFQREWRAEGSLLHLCAEEADSQGSDWERLSADEKCKRLRHHYQLRNGKLQHVEKKFGVFVESALARIYLEAQFQYALALARRDGDVDTVKVSSLFQGATERFPNAPALQIERARFHRRIWSYGEAIAGFTAIAERTRDAADRREAAVDLIESLITAAIYTEDVALPDGTRLNKHELVKRAREWIARLFDFPDVARDVAMLRDQVELELGGEIDWAKNDDAYNSVIGGSECYVSTIVDNLDSLRSKDGDLTTHLWEAVVQNFTHPDVLRGLGRLYMRSAELGRRSEPLRDAERAYGCFNACRILEVSECGRESPVTSHERARAILAGAVIAQSVNPFNADRESSPTLIDLAETRLNSARDRSVGSFHRAAEERLKELRALRRLLKSAAK
jgi:hypothetical protein